jgi:hypothetical protein
MVDSNEAKLEAGRRDGIEKRGQGEQPPFHLVCRVDAGRLRHSLAVYQDVRQSCGAGADSAAALARPDSAGIDNEELLGDPLAQRFFFALLRENHAILRRSGARLARIGPFHPAVVDRILSLPGLAGSLARLFARGCVTLTAPRSRIWVQGEPRQVRGEPKQSRTMAI